MEGLIIDDLQATKTGKWTNGTGLKGFVDMGYLYSGSPDSSIQYKFKAPSTGRHDIRLGYLSHKNRGTKVPVQIVIGDTVTDVTVNMKEKAPLKDNFISLGMFDLKKGQQACVKVSAKTRAEQLTSTLFRSCWPSNC